MYVHTHINTQMHRHPYTHKYPHIHIPWNKKDNNCFSGHPLVSGIPEDLTLGQHYLRESLGERLYWVQDEENPADHLPFQASVTHYWDYWELRNRYWWASAATEKGRYSQTPEGPLVGQGCRLWERDVHAGSFWKRTLGIHTYKGVKARGLGKGRKWIEIYLQKKI